MKFVKFTTVGGIPIAVNPSRIIAVSKNAHGQTVLVYGEESEHDYGHFAIDISFDRAVEILQLESE